MPVSPSAAGTSAASGVTLRDAAVSDATQPPGAQGFRVVRNLEMVPYCLPVPTSGIVEDSSQRWERGRKVFTTSTMGGRGARPGRIDFGTSCGPSSLAELFERDQKAILAETPTAVFTVKTLRSDSYALSWRGRDRIHYGKMWAVKGDEGCFVRANFEYSEPDRNRFDAIIARASGGRPECSDDP